MASASYEVDLAEKEGASQSSSPLIPHDKESDLHPHSDINSKASLASLRNSSHITPLTASILSSLSTLLTLLLSFWIFFPRLHLRPSISSSSLLPHTNTSATDFIYDLAFSRTRPGTRSCGTTIPEALARNCTFDELADLWLPPHCSRHYATQYATSYRGGPQRYWADQAGQNQIFNRSLYVESSQVYWSTVEDHLVHCAFNMYRFAHSLRHGSVVGHDGSFSGHVEHCASLLVEYALQAPGIEEISVETQSGFGYC